MKQRTAQQRSVASSRTFFNSARSAPLPRPTYELMRKMLDREFTQGWTETQQEEIIADLRASIANLINGEISEIAIVQSSSYAINIIVNGISWKSSDNVVITDLAYSSIAQAVIRLRKEHGVGIRVARSEELFVQPESVKRLVDCDTRLVIVPHLPVFCGVVQPIQEIGRELESTGTLFAVNATQSAGQIPIDVRKFNCDFLFGTSRKWIRGPRGVGFLFIRKPLISELRPTNLGYPAGQWIEESQFVLSPTADRFHVGDYPYPALAGFAESIRYAQRIGIENIMERNVRLGRICRSTLSDVPKVELYDFQNGASGTVPFNVSGFDAEEVVDELKAAGITACVINERDALWGLRKLGTESLVRISLHYFNTEDEICFLRQELAGIARRNK